MDDVVEIRIPVSAEAAEVLSGRAARVFAGRVLSAYVLRDAPDSAPLNFLIAQLQAEAGEAERITDAER